MRPISASTKSAQVLGVYYWTDGSKYEGAALSSAAAAELRSKRAKEPGEIMSSMAQAASGAEDVPGPELCAQATTLLATAALSKGSGRTASCMFRR